MRVAFFTPLAPVNSGTADYGSELLPHLAQRAEVEVFVDPAHQREAQPVGRVVVHSYEDFEKLGGPNRYDALLYAIANNPFHLYAYRMALRHPGIVLLHDFNLHHLLAHVTIVGNDWDEYLRLVEEEGGEPALERARLVQQGITGPDYDNLNLNQRLLRESRGAIVHSDYVKGLIESGGRNLPVRMIRHGVRRIEAPPEAVAEARRRLNLPAELLVGSFGFVKRYKRISSCLQALAEARRELPPFRYLLVGEEHSDYPVGEEIERLGLQGNVLRAGRVELDAFWDYILATDICLNLRYPTAGETSGSLLREMAAAKAVVASNLGAFAEWPDNCCAKVDVDAHEVPQLVSYLKLLGAHPALREQLGHNAQAFVRSHCSWEQAAEALVDFLEEPKETSASARAATAPAKTPLPLPPPALGEFILDFWNHRPDAQDYARAHLTRFAESLAWVPHGRPAERLLEMGCYLQMTPLLAKFYGYGEVRGTYVGEVGRSEVREIAHSRNGERYCFAIDKFDAEKDPFPYPNNTFRTVLCCELIEHLAQDPMHMLFEINRILLPDGFLLLSTPNTASWKSVLAVTRGDHPNFFPAFLRPPEVNGHPPAEEFTPQEFESLLAEAGIAAGPVLLRQAGDAGGRHSREYTPKEIQLLLTNAGFEVVRLETHDFYGPTTLPEELRSALTAAGYQEAWGGDTILVLARKASPPRERYPREFYA